MNANGPDPTPLVSTTLLTIRYYPYFIPPILSIWAGHEVYIGLYHIVVPYTEHNLHALGINK
jgi:hypothetical protein